MQRLGFERLRRRDAMERARRVNSGQTLDTIPPKIAAARKRLEDIALARELGIPLSEITGTPAPLSR